MAFFKTDFQVEIDVWRVRKKQRKKEKKKRRRKMFQSLELIIWFHFFGNELHNAEQHQLLFVTKPWHPYHLDRFFHHHKRG